MKLKFSIKQLFLIGVIAAPIWGIFFVSLQGRLWGVGAFYGLVVVLAVLLSMLTLFFVSDRLALLLYQRRQKLRKPVAVPRSGVSQTVEVDSASMAVSADDTTPK